MLENRLAGLPAVCVFAAQLSHTAQLGSRTAVLFQLALMVALHGLLAGTGVGSPPSPAGRGSEKPFDSGDKAAEPVKWMPANSSPFTINGLWWLRENGGEYLRLPKRVELTRGIERKVWTYAHYPAGARVRFRTDSASLRLRIDHAGDTLAWKQFSLMGMAGIEVYEGPPDRMQFRMISTPVSGTQPYAVDLRPFPDRRVRDVTLYLPAYAKLGSLDIAVDPGANVEPPTPFALDKPVVFYGTSFIQGGCASRASMNLPALIGRMLAVDVVNLGFAGDGRCEPEMATIAAEIDAACFVMGPILDNVELMRQNYPRFVAILRERWPDRPIFLMSRLHTVGHSEPYTVNGLVREVYESMRARGDRNVHFFDSFPLYADGAIHPTVEGLHPSDLGFKIIADALAPEVARICRLSEP